MTEQEGYVVPPSNPWQAPRIPPPGAAPNRTRFPSWAVMLVVVGAILALCAGLIGMALLAPDSSRQPNPLVPGRSALEAVEVSGTCQNRIVGSYGLVASVTVRNPSDRSQTGAVWVSWPVTGEVGKTFSERVELAPGARHEFHVNEPIDGERWFRLGKCEYGWAPTG